MAGPKIFGVLFIVFALGLALYLYRSEPIKKLGLDNLTLPNIFPTSTQQTYIQSPPPPAEKPPTYISQPPISQPPPEPTISPYDIPEGFILNDLSPYFRKVRIGSYTSITPNYYGQISMYAYIDSDKLINITGWVLKTNKGNQLVIPKGVEVYSPFGFQTPRDILVKSGDNITVYSKTNPTGVNFRLNKCLGYLEDVFDFTPPLYTNCPYIDRSEIIRFTGKCQDYILSLRSCQIPDSNPSVTLDDYACRDYLSKLNYRGCFERYRADRDFFRSEWRISVEPRLFLESDARHDRILLFDQKGLLVDEYSY